MCVTKLSIFLPSSNQSAVNRQSFISLTHLFIPNILCFVFIEIPCGMTVRPTVRPAMRSEMPELRSYLGSQSRIGSFRLKCFLQFLLIPCCRPFNQSESLQSESFVQMRRIKAKLRETEVQKTVLQKIFFLQYKMYDLREKFRIIFLESFEIFFISKDSSYLRQVWVTVCLSCWGSAFLHASHARLQQGNTLSFSATDSDS